MLNLGNVELGSLIVIPFNTFDANGASVTVTDLAATDVHIHRDGNAAQFTNPSAVTVFINFDGITGNHLILIDTDVSSAVADFQEGSDFQVRLEGITVATQTLNVWIAMFSIVNRAGDITHVGGSSIAGANFKSQYDTTGLSGDTFPATQAQVDNIGAASGGSVNINISEDNTGGVIDPSSAVFVGSVQGGTTFANLEAEDGVVHDIDDVGSDIDIVYGCSVGGGRTASEVSILANVAQNADEIKVKVYDHVGGDWEIIGTIEGTGGTAFKALALDLLLKHTGTGSELGKVYIRFETDSTTPSNISIDKVLVRAVNIGQSVGYANGRIWIDTVNGIAGTEAFVNGVADNPVNLIASAKTLSTSVGVMDFHIINGSTITLAESTVNESYFGDNWTLALGGQDVDGAYFQGAHVTGIGTSATEVHYEGCDTDTMSVQIGHFDFCAFSGTVTMTLAGDYEFHNCYSNVAGAGAPTFTKTAGQAITAEWRNWMDSITVSGLEAGDVITINGRLGTVTLNGADATVEIRGSYKSIVNNLTGSPTVNIDGAWQGSDIADILMDTAEIGTAGAGLTDLGGMSTGMKAEVKAGYSGGAVWIDTNTSNTSTVSYVDGTFDNPVSTIAAATTIAGNLNIKKFILVAGSSITLAQAYNFCTFIGYGATIALGGRSINGAVFIGVKINGNDNGSNSNRVRYFDCDIDGSTLGQFIACRCRLTGGGDLVLAEAGTYFLDACYSGVAGTTAPSIDFGVGLNASNLNMRHYSGGIEIKNMGKGTGNYNMSLEGVGQLIINASCTADGGGVSTVAIRGNFTIIDNASAAVTLSENARIDVGQVNAEVDTALSDYAPNTVVPDAAGTASGLHTTTDALVNAVGALVVALNDLSAAQVNAEVDTALNDYDSPTKAEMDAVHATTDALIAALNNVSVANLKAQADLALTDIHLHQLLAANYDPAAKPGTATALLNELVENDSGVSRYTANALEEAPSGAGLTGTQNAALLLIRDIMEGDATIDMTTTPWQLVVKLKSTATEKLRKDLKDVNGVNLAAVSTIIGQVLEP